MPPPHQCPPIQVQFSSRLTSPAEEPLKDEEYIAVASMLTTLFDKFPQAFRLAAGAVKGIYDAIVKQ